MNLSLPENCEYLQIQLLLLLLYINFNILFYKAKKKFLVNLILTKFPFF